MNEDTLTLTTVAPSVPDEHPRKTNPLIQRIRIPGETFRIPSSGIFYDETVLDSSVQDGEVHVHPMTTYEEILMKTPDLLFSGEAVRQVFRRCIPQILDPDKLLAKDVDFLLLCLRKVSFGEKLSIDYTHNCMEAKKHSYEINLSSIIQKARRIEPGSFNKDFNLKLTNGQTVVLTPLTFKDYVEIMQNVGQEASEDHPTKVAAAYLKSILSLIKQVDEVSDKEMILEWLNSLPPMILKQLVEHIDVTAKWGADFKSEITCADCREIIEVDLPLNPLTFFT